MTSRKDLPNGQLYGKEDVVIYEMPMAGTNLVDPEQLEELKREDPLFFQCKHYIVEDGIIRIFYNWEKEYRTLEGFRQATGGLKKRIAEGILSVERLIGTQYTTVLHPDNIFADRSGRVKLAYRGIRSVSPEEELNAAQLLEEQKKILLYLFTNNGYSPDAVQHDSNPMTAKIMSAQSTHQLRQVILDIGEVPDASPVKNNRKVTAKKEKSSPGKSNNRMTLLSGLLIGLLIGMIVIYAVQVMPLTEELNEVSAAEEREINENIQLLTEKNEELQMMLDENSKIMHGYRSAIVGDAEEAIKAFESSAELDESAERTLIEQYLQLGTIEGYKQAAEMNEAYHDEAVAGLVALDNEGAGEAILSIESEQPTVLIEQAWIRNDHDEVVALFGELKENNRAKLLAAQSHIELENTDEALILAEELDNKGVQIAALEKEKKLVEADDDLDEEESDEAIKKLNDRIKDLKD